jgi:hypothetical protein
MTKDADAAAGKYLVDSQSASASCSASSIYVGHAIRVRAGADLCDAGASDAVVRGLLVDCAPQPESLDIVSAGLSPDWLCGDVGACGRRSDRSLKQKTLEAFRLAAVEAFLQRVDGLGIPACQSASKLQAE